MTVLTEDLIRKRDYLLQYGRRSVFQGIPCIETQEEGFIHLSVAFIGRQSGAWHFVPVADLEALDTLYVHRMFFQVEPPHVTLESSETFGPVVSTPGAALREAREQILGNQGLPSMPPVSMPRKAFDAAVSEWGLCKMIRQHEYRLAKLGEGAVVYEWRPDAIPGVSEGGRKTDTP